MGMRNGIEHVSKHGLIQGALGAIKGSAFFTFVDTIMLLIVLIVRQEFNVSTDLDDQLVIAMVLFVFGCIFAIIPGLYGGKWLAHLLYRDALAGSLTRQKAIMKGTILGMFAGFGICVFVVTFLYTRGDFNILIFRIISAVVIAGWMGGWAGAKLADNIAHITK